MLRVFVFLLAIPAVVGIFPSRFRKVKDGLTPSTEEIEYACSFDGSLWSAERHPKDYPSASAHWSPPVVASHSSAYTLWETGTMASKGVESVAEEGSTSILKRELDQADGVLDYEILNSQGGMKWRAGNVVRMDPTHDQLSSISMIAPSPDWFSGFKHARPINEETGNWYYSFTLTTAPYDAGTEKGDGYSIFNPDQNPKRKIRKIKPSNAPGDGILVTTTASGSHVKKVARWTCWQPDGREDCEQLTENEKAYKRCKRRNMRRDNP